MSSTAVIMEILGYRFFLAIEFARPGRAHFILLKSDMPNQVSSTLITVFLERSSFRKAKANCCRRIRFLGSFALQEVDSMRLYLRFSS